MPVDLILAALDAAERRPAAPADQILAALDAVEAQPRPTLTPASAAPPAAATRGMLPPSRVPMQAHGITDPASVKVTPAPPRGRGPAARASRVPNPPLDGVVPQIAKAVARSAAEIPAGFAEMATATARLMPPSVPGLSTLGAAMKAAIPAADAVSAVSREVRDSPALAATPEAAKIAAVDPLTNPEVLAEPDWWIENVSQGLGSQLAFLLPAGLINTLTKMPAAVAKGAPLLARAKRMLVASRGVAAGAALEAAVEAGMQQREALDKGVEPERAAELAAKAFAAQFTLLMGTAVPGYVLPGASRLATRAAAAAAGESVQEGGQQAISNVVAKEYDPTRTVSQGVVPGMIVGGVVGGGTAAAVRPAPPAAAPPGGGPSVQPPAPAAPTSLVAAPVDPILAALDAVEANAPAAPAPPATVVAPSSPTVAPVAPSVETAGDTTVSATLPTETTLDTKRAAYKASIDNGDPDDVAAAYVLKYQERADERGEAMNLWRSANGQLGLVPAGQLSPFINGGGTLIGRFVPSATAQPEVESPRSTPSADLPEGKPEPRKFSSTQVNLPAPLADAIVAKAAAIPDEELAPDGRAGATPDTAPHVTVKYGLHTSDAEEVRALLADEPPVTVTLGQTSIFPNGESGSGDVVKVDVDSPDLRRLNAKIADALDVTDTHPDYKPHVTIAYVKPGLGEKYAGDESLKGQAVTIDTLSFMGKDGQQVDIPLTGRVENEGNKITSDSQPPPEPSTREPWQMTRAEFKLAERQPKVDAIKAALKRGTPITLVTNTKATRLAIPEHIRITKAGDVQIPRGRSWDTLTDQQIDALAEQAGIKAIPYGERTYHRAAVEEALQAGRDVPAAVRAEYPDIEVIDPNESDQDRSHREWKENADRVARDPELASAKDLNRAAGYLSHRLVAERRNAEKEGRPVNASLIDSLNREIEYYTRLQTEKAGTDRPAPQGQVDTPTPPAQTDDRGAGTETGPGRPDDRGERPVPDDEGADEGPGEGVRPDRRWLPSPDEYPLEAFERATPAADRQRLTPEVTRELERIASELEEFPYVERTWSWVDENEVGWTGNAAGGHANIVGGAAGAAVYDDILNFAPLNKAPRKTYVAKAGDTLASVAAARKLNPAELARANGLRSNARLTADQKLVLPHKDDIAGLAKEVGGDRADVARAVRSMLASGTIHNNLAEGAARVAERRAADDYRYISRPILPPSWGEELPADLEAAIDAALAEEQPQPETTEDDDSFDIEALERDLAAKDDPDDVRQPRAKYGKDRELIIQHNVTAANLLHAARLGGFPVPSLAITKATDSLTNFGEITLLGPKEMADPQGYARTRVFGADVYSPRYPTIHYKFDAKAEKRVSDLYRKHAAATGLNYYDLDQLEKDGAKFFERESSALMVEFLESRGLPIPEPVLDKGKYARPGQVDTFQTRYAFETAIRDANLENEYRTFAAEFFESLNPSERIFRGFTNQGNRSYKPHTLENVVAILKKELRGGESSSNLYGVGQLRSKFTPQFRTVGAIRAAKDRIVSDEAFEATKKEVETELFRIVDKLKAYYEHEADSFRFVDTVMAVIEDGAKKGVPFALKDYGFTDVPTAVKEQIAAFMTKLRTLPTEYFEAKILREVDLTEFAAAVVPDNVRAEVLDLLKSRGVQAVTYKAGDMNDRKRVVAETAQSRESDVLFEKRTQYGSQPQAKRGRPKNMVAFSPAISGPSGAKLYGYQWHWTTDLIEDKREGIVERRVSDWENAVPNETTGRDIVHEFLLERKDGTVASVSLETALRELGYLAQTEGSKEVRGIASTLKTLARARMDRDRLLPLNERHEVDLARAQREVDGLTVPAPVITREVLDQGGTVRFRVTVGDEYQMRFNRAATVEEYRRTSAAQEHIGDVVADWRGAKVQERVTVPWSSKERFALEAAEESIRKAEQRLAKAGVNLTDADTLDTGEVQPRLPGAEDVREQDIKTPELEAPFALTPETSKAKKGRQDTLFDSGAKIGEQYDRRPDTDRAKSDRLAQGALFDLNAVERSATSVRQPDGRQDDGAEVPSRRVGSAHLRPGGSVRALGIRSDLVNTQRLELRGNTLANGAHDIAALAQVARDPRFETLRTVYVKNGADGVERVVATEAISSRTPDSVVGFIQSKAERHFIKAQIANYGTNRSTWPHTVTSELDKLRDDSIARFREAQKARMVRLGADGYYLIHNHPSGMATPSPEDLRFTRNKGASVDGLRGHVVIDTGEYAVITPSGAVSMHKIDNDARLHTAAVPHEVIGMEVGHPTKVRDVGKRLTHPGGATFIFTTGSPTGGYAVRAVETVPYAMLTNPEVRGFLTRRKTAYGGGKVLVYLDDSAPATAQAAALRLFTNGAVLDVVTSRASAVNAGLSNEDVDIVPASAHRVGEDERTYGKDDTKKRIALDDVARIAQRRRLPLERVRQVAEQAGYVVVDDGPRPARADSGRELPPQKPIPAEKLHEFPSIQKMPESIRADIEDMLQRYHGFEAQRRGVQSWDRTTEIAKDLWLPLETLKPGTALNAEELNAYQTAIATALTMRKPILERIQDGSATDWDRLQASHLTDVATVLTASYRGAKAEAGRALNILRVKARVLDLQESRFLEMALKAPGFNKDLTAVSKAALDAAGDPLKQLQLLRRRSGTWFDYVQAAYYTNLLSGIKTHLRNAIGNSFNVLANTITPIGAAGVDIARSARTGQERTAFLGEIPQNIVGGFIGAQHGLKNAAFTFVNGFRPSTVAAAGAGQFDSQRVELTIPDAVIAKVPALERARAPFEMIVNWPSRALEAADEFFRAVAWHQEIYAGAYAQARREGLRDRGEIAERMAALMAAVDPATADGKVYRKLAERADKFSARAVFQEEPGPIVQWLLKAKSPTSPIPLRAAALFLTPFIKTPSAILRQGAEWSPAGFAMKGAREGGREGAQAVGRAVLGTGFILGPIAWLAATGRLTGAPPDDERDREEFYAQGKLANAVRIGDYWVRYVLFQPFSVPMAAVANAWEKFRDSDQDEGAAEEAFTAAVAGAGASLLDQSFLAGLGTFIDAVNDPTRYAGQWLNLFAQGFVPYAGLMRNVTQAVDPVVRRPQGVAESVQSIIPGQSSTLTPRRTRFGDEARRPGGFIQRGFLVPEVSKAIDDAVTSKLAQLGVKPTVPDGTFTVRGEKLALTREQQDAVIETIGRERRHSVERVMAAPSFVGLSEEQQRVVIERAIGGVTERVRPRVLAAVRDGRPITVQSLMSPLVRAQSQRD